MAQQAIPAGRSGFRIYGPKIIDDNFSELYSITDGLADLQNISTSSYTLTLTDTAGIIRTTSNTAVIITLPNNLPIGFSVGILQEGTGQVTFTAASGATLYNRQNFTKTAGRYAEASLTVFANSNGTSAQYVLSGDVAA